MKKGRVKKLTALLLAVSMLGSNSAIAGASGTGAAQVWSNVESSADVLDGTEARITATYEDGSEEEYTAGGFDNHLEMDLNKKTGKLSRAMSASIDGTGEPSKETETTKKETEEITEAPKETEKITEAPKETEKVTEKETEETETETSAEGESEVELESETSSEEESEMISLPVFKDEVIESEKYMELDADELGGEDGEETDGELKELKTDNMAASRALSPAEQAQVPTTFLSDIRHDNDPSVQDFTNNSKYNNNKTTIYRTDTGELLPSKYTARVKPTGKTLITGGYQQVNYGAKSHSDAYVITTTGKQFVAVYSNAVTVGKSGTVNYGVYDMKATITDYKFSRPFLNSGKRGTPYLGFTENGGVYTHGLEWVTVRYDFLVHGTSTPVNLSGIFRHRDIDHYQGIEFLSGIEALVLRNTDESRNLKLTVTSNGHTYLYCPLAKFGDGNDITFDSTVLFSGSSVTERYTFVVPPDYRDPFPYGNMQVASGDLSAVYTPPTFSLSKYVNKNNDAEAYSSQDQYVGNAASGDKFSYWLRVTGTAVNENSMYLSSLSITDTVPKWLNLYSIRIFTGGSDVTSLWFNVTTSGNTVTATAKSDFLSNKGFYGRTYDIRITCTVKTGDFYTAGEPTVASDQRYYQIKNTASLSTNAQSTVSASVDAYLLRPVANGTPTITKQVSNSSSSGWGSSNMISSTSVFDAAYYYRLTVIIPAKTDSHARDYKSLYIEDAYPNWIQDITDVQVTSGGTAVTNWKFSSNGGGTGRNFRLTADVTDQSLYGKTYTVLINARTVSESEFKTLSKPPKDSSGYYYWTNSAKVVAEAYSTVSSSGTDTKSSTSGNVTTRMMLTETKAASIEVTCGASTNFLGDSSFSYEHVADVTSANNKYVVSITIPQKGTVGYQSLNVAVPLPAEVEPTLVSGSYNLFNYWWYPAGDGSYSNRLTVSSSGGSGYYSSYTNTINFSFYGGALDNNSFYGKTYKFAIELSPKTKSDILAMSPKMEGNYAYWDLAASVSTVYTNGTSENKKSNNARMKMPIVKPSIPAISKGVGASSYYSTGTEYSVSNIGSTYDYTIRIPVLSQRGDVDFSYLRIEDTLPKEVTFNGTTGSVSLQATTTRYTTTPLNEASIGVVRSSTSGDKVTITLSSSFISSYLYNYGAYLFFDIRIPVKVRSGMDFSGIPVERYRSNACYVWRNKAEIKSDLGSYTSNTVSTYLPINDLTPAPIKLEKNVVANSEYDNWKISQKSITVDSSYSTASYTNASGATETGKKFSYHIIFSPGASTSTTLATGNYVITDEVPKWAKVTSVECRGFANESSSYNYYDYDLTASIDSANNIVTVRQAASGDLAGKYYVIVVNCVVRNSDFLSIGEPASDAVNYYWDNQAKLSYTTNDAVRNREMTSNTARVNVPKENFETTASLKKYIGTSESTTSNTTDFGGTYAYRIKVSVGSRTDTPGFTRNYLDKVVVKDSIPCFLDVTSVSVSNSTYLSAATYIDPDSGVTEVTVSDKSGAVKNSSFYGKDYTVTINVRVKNDFSIPPELSGNNYVWYNTALLDTGRITLESNRVTTTMPARVNVTLRKISAKAMTDEDPTPPGTGSGNEDESYESGDEFTLQGVTFRIWCSANGYDKTLTTDALGEIELKKLTAGTYSYRETMTIAGYVLDSTTRTFTVSGTDCTNNSSTAVMTGSEGNRVLTIENKPTQIAIYKRAEDTNEMLAGAKLVLKDSSGNIIEPLHDSNEDKSFTTSATEPSRFSRLPAGIYTIEEIEAPVGYAVSDPVTITVANTASIQTYTVVDPVAETTVTVGVVIQRDQTVLEHGNPVFTLELTGTDQRGTGHTYHGMVEFDESAVNSGESPILSYVFKNVQRGTYQLNWKCPVGYYVKYVGNMSSNVTSTIKTVPVFGSTLPVITIDNTKKGNVAGADDYASTVTLTFYKQTYDDYRHSSSAVNKITIQ